MISCCEVVDHHLVVDGFAEYSLALYEGNRVAGEEVVPGFFGLVWYAWVRKLHVVVELYLVILPGATSMLLLS